ncbi:MAG: hypothetical protein KC425_11805 [Anaerolineales bacterium]|nr:hypothetical protein [Anaerolineales bacterium]MCA9974513.1 hypothetical protein [Anaerolineales bacterium]
MKHEKPDKPDKQRASTLAALLEEKPKRGRPERAIKRQNVYVALSAEQKALMKRLAGQLPDGLGRADLPDLAVSVLAARLEALRRAVAGRNREIPEGITDMASLFLLWDLALPPDDPERKWTSIRLSPQPAIELGRAHGTLNAVFGANRSQTFELALLLLAQFLEDYPTEAGLKLLQLREKILDIYL